MITTIHIRAYIKSLHDIDDLEGEINLSEDGIKEIAKAYISGKHPSETDEIIELIDSIAIENPYRKEYSDFYKDSFFNEQSVYSFDHALTDEIDPNTRPLYTTARNYASDDWFEVFPEIDEILEHALWNARKSNDLPLLRKFGVTQAEGYIISEISRQLLDSLPNEIRKEYKSRLSPRHLNDLMVEEGFLCNLDHGRGITDAGKALGIYTVRNPGDEEHDAYEQIFYSGEARDKVIEAVRSRYPELVRETADPYDIHIDLGETIQPSEDDAEAASGTEKADAAASSCFPGKYCCMMTFGQFKETGLQRWLNIMKENYAHISPYPLEDAEIRAWEDEYHVLRNIPSKYSDLTMLFEYVLPANRHRGEEPDLSVTIRADLIILSADTVAVFEFKQKENDDHYTINAAKKYRKSIRRYHKNSVGMRKKAALVLTIRTDYFSRHHRLRTCSPDRLHQIMDEFFEEHRQPHSDPGGWADTEFLLLHD